MAAKVSFRFVALAARFLRARKTYADGVQKKGKKPAKEESSSEESSEESEEEKPKAAHAKANGKVLRIVFVTPQT